MGLASGVGEGVMGAGDRDIGVGGNIVRARDGEKGGIELAVVECTGADPGCEIDAGRVTVKNVDKEGVDGGEEDVELTEEIVGREIDKAAGSEGHDGVGLPV